jgi:5-methyltetrahydrofolate--homocysteine methyltransferase
VITLIFNNHENGDPLFAFIEHFSNVEAQEEQTDEEYQNMPPLEKVQKLLLRWG